MSKENIHGYHTVQCCRTCKYWSERLDDSIDPDFQSICKLYGCDIDDYCICDSFQKSKRDFGNE